MTIRVDIERAFPQIEEALARDPLNEDIQRTRVWALIRLGRLEEAVAAGQRLFESNPERGGRAVALSTALNESGRHEQALAIGRQEPLPFLRLTLEALAYDALGDRAASEERLATLVEVYGDDVSYQVAAIHSRRGDLDEAFAALERGFAIRDPGLTYIQLHTAFDPIRDDPRYDAFLAKMGFK